MDSSHAHSVIISLHRVEESYFNDEDWKTEVTYEIVYSCKKRHLSAESQSACGGETSTKKVPSNNIEWSNRLGETRGRKEFTEWPHGRRRRRIKWGDASVRSVTHSFDCYSKLEKSICMQWDICCLNLQHMARFNSLGYSLMGGHSRSVIRHSIEIHSLVCFSKGLRP